MVFFLKEPFYSDRCFYIKTRSVYFPSTAFHLFENDVTHFLAEYFLGLICRLGIRVGSIFRSLFSTQSNIIDGVFLRKQLTTTYRKSETQDQGLGAWDPYVGPGICYSSPGALHPGPETRDPQARPMTRNLYVGPGPATLHLGPETRNPTCGTIFEEKTRGTKVRKPILFMRAQFFVLF